ncbi:MAG: hypothetical protein HKO59_04275, partial [Phycisphaerales bacterium]|nr:hypothetical protein [Phycisphaerales bacterium]
MSVARDGQPPDPSRLAAHEGRVLLTAIETVLKGVLESEAEASVLATPRAGVFGEVFRTAQEDGVTRLLTRHELELAAVPDASRAVTAALHAARSGGGALALVPNDQLPSARESLVAAAGETLTRGARLCLLLEDAPQDVPDVSPRTIIPQLGLACIEPATLEELRDAVELALRLSRTGAQAVGLIVHDSLLRSAATIEVRPNRVIDSVDAMLARRRGRRRPRVSEAADTLRFVRRLELNRATGLPSPGERTPVGFVTVGPAHAALQHVISSLGLAGRVASLQLGAVNPLDEPAVVRLLERCEHVLVLEPRPGEIETRVLAIAEATRRRGAKPGLVWGQTLPAGDGESASSTLGVDEAVHPSLLARRIIHVLHRLRPTGRVAGRLVPDPPRLVSDLPARDAGFGAAAAAVFIRRVLVDVDQWLRDRTEDERGTPVPRTVLAVDGARPETMADRETIVEVWDASAFLRGG